MTSKTNCDNQRTRKGKIAEFDHDHSMLNVIYSVMFDSIMNSVVFPYRATSLIICNTPKRISFAREPRDRLLDSMRIR